MHSRFSSESAARTNETQNQINQDCKRQRYRLELSGGARDNWQKVRLRGRTIVHPSVTVVMTVNLVQKESALGATT